MTLSRFLPVLTILFLSGATAFGQAANEYFKPLKYRSIGPFRGGRSVTATGVPGDPLTYYMGTTGGGLWKTSDAGQLWKNISDGYFKTGSVGAIAVAPSNPNILYCGMGEHAPRGVMTSYGDGVYKSTDAGKTWTHLGLEKTQHISRIRIHPTNPDIVYVAAQGALYGPNPERGIFKTIDGGKTWEKILFVDERTGCVELSMDMNTPEVLYAAMWEHGREPNRVISGGPGSGLHKSTDGGSTWVKMKEGLPEELGKMAIAVSPANPQKVYALIESDSNAEKGGLFVSEDAGDSWERVSGDHRLIQRAWYYIEVFPDPVDEHTVYVMSAPALRSIDGGKTWEVLPDAHGDYHDLWINPDNPKNMVLADDGGAAITFNRGQTWSTQENMPTAQFYRISTDNLFPYNIYGGQQDNTSVRITSLAQGRGGIGQEDWTYAAGGESAFLAFDPDHPRYVLGGNYLGTIEVLDMENRSETQIMAAPIEYLGREARDMKYLYNWNAPIIRSVHEPNTYYHCAQLVLRTRDMGKSWEEISPDLTRNIDEKQGLGGGPYTNEAVGAENYGTISYIIESPTEAGLFYTGSDDGLVHITRDNGESWQDITPKGQGETLVNAIEISPHSPSTVYIATTRYKFNDYTPALMKSTDYGKTWTNISSGIPYGAFTRAVREDPVRKDLLYAGTETGVYISWNGGKEWEPLQLNLPVTPVTDLKIHRGDLIVATSGRSFWILDDLAPMQQYQSGGKALKLYTPEAAYNGSWSSSLNATGEEAKATHPLQGVNPANGMPLYYYLPEVADSLELKLEIRDAKNRLVRSFSSEKDSTYRKYDGGPPEAAVLSKKPGLNRFVWDMQYPIMPGIPDVYIEANFEGRRAIPGTYKLILTAGSQVSEVSGTILEVPGFETEEGQYDTYDAFMGEMEDNLREMHGMVNRLYKGQQQLKVVLAGLEKGPLKTQGEAVLKEMQEWDEEMIQRKSKAYDDVENYPNKFTANYLFLIGQTNSAIPRVNEPNRERRQELDARWDELKARGEALLRQKVPAYNKELWAAGIGAIQIPD